MTTTEPDQLSAAKRALLEQRLRTASKAAASHIPRRPGDGPPPLSYAQERMWFMEQFAPNNGAYGSTVLARLGPDADLGALREALTALSARHESLRMTFPATGDGRPAVVVGEPVAYELTPIAVADEAELDREVERLANRPFDLTTGPLLRPHVLLVTGDTGPADTAVLLDLHHIVTDGWSNDVLLTDLAELYAAARDGRPARLGDPGRYGDFAAWQRDQLESPAARRHLDYWLRQLASVPALELPADAPRPAVQTFGGASYRFVLPAELAGRLEAFGRAHRATPFMTLLAAYQAVLGRWSGQTDFAVGSPVAGRGHPDLDGMVGMFNNMLPLRADLTGDLTAATLVERTRDTVLDALAHQDVPFEKVVNDLGVVRDVSRPAIFQAMFVLQNYEMRANAEGGLPWRPVDLPATRFDLELHAFTVPNGDLHCRFVRNTALFGEATIARLADSLTTLLTAMLDDPDAPVGALELLGPADRALLDGWNATAAPVPDATLPGLVAAQIARTPHAPAVVAGDRTLTYAELDALANRIANRLRAGGVGVGDLVAVCANRSVELVAALLGVQRTGAAYVPLDPEYPADRLAFMLEDSAAKAVLTQRDLVATLPEWAAVLELDDPDEWADQSTVDPGVAVPPAAPAYLIYTSGSTGRPKGVPNAHRGIVNRLDWMQQRFGLGPGDVVLQKTPASFDVSVWEFFWPLLTGATLVLAKPGGQKDPAYLREAIDAHGVTTVHFVPSMLAAFLADADGGVCPSLKRIVCSGEELPLELATRCLAAMPHAELHNLYGPTEAAVDVTAYACTPQSLAGRTRVPIGAPVANTTVHVLDARGARVPVGAVGELHLGGVQVALGYARRPGLTARRFVPDPFGPPGSRLYATGDLARWRDDGTVEFLGRMDGQVKLRGLRIELGEIEAALRDLPGIADAAVAVKEGAGGDKRLVGYVVGSEPDAAHLREVLKKRLPDYMVPAAYVPLEALPLSPAGKLDRRALPDPAPAVATGDFVEPATDDERAIAAIWQEVLGADRVGAEDDFFALGGHSLLATQVVAKLRPLTAERAVKVGVMDLFQHPTVRGLASLLSADAPTGPRRLLYELTKKVPDAERVCSYVCVPYGGGSAIVYQPVADLMPAGHSLWAVGIPGHDIGLDDEGLAFSELVERCATEVLERVPAGPLVLYGHCGVGGALVTELARRLEAAGRPLEAVYAGGVFPFARPAGRLARFHTWLEDRASNRGHQNWMKSMGVDMADIEPEQADRIISNMRRDSNNAEEHFTQLLHSNPPKVSAPFISVVGERDPITDYYTERYREWRFLTDTTAVVVLDEAGHFFLRYRAQDVVDIMTTTHRALAEHPDDLETVLPVRDEPPAKDEPGRPRWWVEGVARAGDADDPGVPEESSMRRFAVVSFGQLISSAGSALTGWAIPIWLYLKTGSLALFGLTGIMAVVPILIATPIAGAVADRYDRRRVIMAASCVVLGLEAVFAVMLLLGDPPLWTIYVLVWLLSSAGTFQRVAFTAAIPQLAPKRFLGHANGVAQLINGVALLFVPVLAAGLFAAIGLGGILVLDIVSYVFAIGVLAAVRFPNLLGHRRRETFREAVFGGWQLTWRTPAFRAMLVFFGISNLLYAAPVLLVTPLVLSFAGTAQVGQVAVAEGLGALAGGLAMTFWGGPRRNRMRVNILAIALSGLFVAVTGLHATLPVVLAGVLGTAFSLSVANGLYMTIIQVKVPQRYHGRVFALNQTVTWSTLPIGFALLVPAAGWFDRFVTGDGALAGTVGRVIGTGEGRGIGLAYLVLGLGMVVNALVALRIRRLAKLDTELPDSLPDDLVGVQVLEEREAHHDPEAAQEADRELVASGRAALPGVGGPARPDAGRGRHRA